MSVLDDIREEFPFLAFLVNDREIGKLLREAVDPNKGFSPQRFQAKLMNTNWWKSQSESQRAWQVKIHTDAGSATRERNSYYAALRQVANQLGVKLTANELRFIGEVNLARGIDPNSPETLATLAQLRNKKGNQTTGSIRTNARRVSMIADSQYYLGLSSKESQRWGEAIALGNKTEADFQQFIQDRAASRYPHLRDRIMAGETMESMFSGHIQTIAEELEIAPETINLRNSRWSMIMDQVDPETKKHRPLSLYETRILARQDPKFWKTQHGQAEDAQMATMMAQTFGKRA